MSCQWLNSLYTADGKTVYFWQPWQKPFSYQKYSGVFKKAKHFGFFPQGCIQKSARLNPSLVKQLLWKLTT
jgi:hypothetical protein